MIKIVHEIINQFNAWHMYEFIVNKLLSTI